MTHPAPHDGIRRLAVLALIVAWGLGLATPVRGQAADPPPAADPAAAAPVATPTPQEQLAAKLLEVTAELERVAAQLAEAGEQPPEHLVRGKQLLERTQLLISQQEASLEQKRQAATALAELEQALAQMRTSGPTETPPYSVLLLDEVRDELQTLRRRIETMTAGVAAAKQALELAAQEHARREAERRRAREATETNKDETKAASLARDLRLAELESRVQGEQRQLRQLELQHQEILSSTLAARLALLEERERWIGRDTVFTPDDLQTKIVELEAREDQLRRQLVLEQSRVDFAQGRWFEAKRRLDAAIGADEGLTEEVNARRLLFQAEQRHVAVIAKRLERLALMKEMWTKRFGLVGRDQPRAFLKEWQTEIEKTLDGLATEGRLQELELRDQTQSLVGLQERLDGLDAARTDIATWIRQQIEQTSELRTVFEANATSIASARRLAERITDDLRAEMTTVRWADRFDAIRKSLKGIWQFEITSVDDRAITVGKIVVALTFLFIGFFIAKLVSTWLGRRVLPRFGLNEGAAAAIRSVVFYVLLVSLFFFALRTANFPLTAFTILGGAVAIGVGFGSQNIMNNFMSGLILLLERPIRVGDLIEIGNLYGVVQHIGARSTRVLTGENIEILVPNSAFLENQVVNLTLSETRVRTHVTVGVSYGSPTRDVAKLLQRAVEEHGRVLKSPAPVVLFTEFGDNALNFEVHFWIVMRAIMQRRVIESDVRYRIDGLFREAGIVIAFPQRDVHIDSARPVEVRLVTGDGDAPVATLTESTGPL